MRVVVVGAGVAGLGVARGLSRLGAEIVVVERGRIGGGATWGGAGWICPVQAGPLPAPGMIGYGVRSLFDRNSALHIAPNAIPRMLGWLGRFALACNEQAHRAGVAALSVLGYRAFSLMEELIADGADFALYKRGLLAVATREQPVRRFSRGLNAARELGYDIPSDTLAFAALRQVEPALPRAMRHGLLIGHHWHVDSAEMAAALGAFLRERAVRIEEQRPVVGVIVENRRARAVLTSSGAIEADVVVLAAGAWTASLAKSVGARLPIVGAKGYSFSVRPPLLPSHALLLLEPHIACSPFGHTLRVAGMLEFSGLESPIDSRRVEMMKRQVRPLFCWSEGEEGEPWAGLRPIAPDGLPVVGRLTRFENVYVATGYSMLGITLGLPAGEALARFIVQGKEDTALRTFSPERFHGARR
jgi:D-amino-acid dehydrogenase